MKKEIYDREKHCGFGLPIWSGEDLVSLNNKEKDIKTKKVIKRKDGDKCGKA